jgi:hypothetical protein
MSADLVIRTPRVPIAEVAFFGAHRRVHGTSPLAEHGGHRRERSGLALFVLKLTDGHRPIAMPRNRKSHREHIWAGPRGNCR